MCRALIIGAGGVGTVVTQKIAANPVFSDVMLASRTKSKCDAVAAAIGGNRVKTAQVDADNVPELCELFRAFRYTCIRSRLGTVFQCRSIVRRYDDRR